MVCLQAVGLEGDATFDAIVKHFTDMGGDVVLFNPEMIIGKSHIMSAVMHADRSFSEGTNRSRTILTEIILYAAGERQIGKAMNKMRPTLGDSRFAAAVLNIDGDLRLEQIGMTRNDGLLNSTPEKAEKFGLKPVQNISFEDLILEKIATVDLLKQ